MKQEEVDQLQVTIKEFKRLQHSAEDRIEEVLDIIANCFKTDIAFWNYSSCDNSNGYGGCLEDSWNGKRIKLYVELCESSDHYKVTELMRNFKIEWLAMENSNIEVQISSAVKEVELAKLDKEAKKKKKEQAILSLTKEQREALGL